MDCVVIGGGMAGLQAALTMRRFWPDKRVILVDTEPEVGYYRTLLPQYMMRTLAEKKIFFWRPGEDPLFSVQTGARVEALDRENRCLHLGNKEKIEYRRLIIATGGRPVIPPVCPDSACGGIFPVRSLAAARAVRAWLPDHQDVVVLGGGLVGVKTAVHLAHFNQPVTVIEKENRLLPQALSPGAALPVEAHLAGRNIRLELGCSVEDLRLETGEIRAVKAGGKWIPCRTLLVAAGSVPDIGFLAESGLLVDGQLNVAPTLQTGDDRIFAAGDAVTISAEGRFTPWTWPQAAVQGKLAAANLYAGVPVPLKDLSRVNSMNLNGLSLVVLGAPVPGAEVITYRESEGRVHRELFLLDGKIVGGALAGDISGAGPLQRMMITGREVGSAAGELLVPGCRAFSRFVRGDFEQKRRARILKPAED